MEKLKKDLERLEKIIDKNNIKRNKLINQIQKKCPHYRVKKSGGDVWHDWPEYGYHPYYLTCLECDKVVSSDRRDSKQAELYDRMNKNVVEDISYKGGY